MSGSQKTTNKPKLNENYRGNGAQTPTVKKIVPMPIIKPAKTETNKK